MSETEILLSVPPAAAQSPAEAFPQATFAASDPPGRQLGSGGGTANLLVEAWKATGGGLGFAEWLRASRKLVIHGSGQSRRLPAYAAEGKLMLPLPQLASVAGQKIDQTLLDMQQSDYGHLLRHAPEPYRVVVACGDVLIREEKALPIFPDADVLIAGIPASPAEASNHGVMFCPAEDPEALEFFLQKPKPARIAELSGKFSFYLDTGIWFLTERAIDVLLRKCGWRHDVSAFADGACGAYELFDSFGTGLGRAPVQRDADIAGLRSAVLPLPNGRFYHFGTNRSVFTSIAQLANPAESRRSFGHSAREAAHDRILLNADAAVAESVHPLWIENAHVPATWTLHGSHVITGIPSNAWSIDLPAGVCLDMPAMRGASGRALRLYGFDDAFKGAVGDASTRWLGAPAPDWFARRGLTLEAAGLDPAADIQNAPLFPVVDPEDATTPALLQWMATPADDESMRARWRAAPRVSATDIVQGADVATSRRQRLEHVRRDLGGLSAARWAERARLLDLEAAAGLFRALGAGPPEELPDCAGQPLAPVHDAIFRSVLKGGDASLRETAFARLRKLMIAEMTLQPVKPSRNILDDQIVWGRSPARLDLAGGWSDTPPYCLEHGGQVVNIAVDLNGQPPVQAFARVCEAPRIVLHSIDLGISESVETYEDLLKATDLGGFSIARAALRLAGFDPMFHRDGGARTLRDQLLAEFGGGIELSMLAAIPKGSGLGTSSILSATILGVLGEVCNHGWTPRDVFARTSVLEQILTSGGGWQDQVGGIAPGVKFTRTNPDLAQNPDIRWLPEALLEEGIRSGRFLLYYTGLTRLARNILGEIVRGIFLNSRRTIAAIEDIACNAAFTAEAIQRNDEAALREAIRRSWQLNCALDSGTCPPQVARITEAIEPFGAAYKLLGAGGGGYLLILAPDLAAAAGIKDALLRHPPNPQARFVAMAVSRTGMQITRS